MSSPAETAARGHRATMCNEFLGPILKETRDGYLARIAELAVNELDPKTRAEKITALSVAMKVLGNVENGLTAAIEAGKVADKSILRATEVEKLGPSRRRLLDLVSTR